MLEQLGARVRYKAGNLFYALGFFLLVFKETVLFVKRRQVGFRVLVMQIFFTGFEALGIISLLALALGGLIIIQGFSVFSLVGQTRVIYQILIIIITCLLYTSPSPRDRTRTRMPSSA